MTFPPKTPDWFPRAACRGLDPDLFFLGQWGNPETVKEAKRVCAGCEVRRECLDYALDNCERFGVFGGTTPKQRRRMRRERKEAAA